MSEGRGRLYFLQVAGGGPIKIGYTRDVRSRLTSLGAWSPWPLEVLHAIEAPPIAEVYCLELFRAHKMRGEWCHPAPEILQFIDAIKATGVVRGCPQPITPADKGCTATPRFDAVIPSIWPDVEAMASELGVVTIGLKSTGAFSDRTICKIILAARRRGRHVETSDLVGYAQERPMSFERPAREAEPDVLAGIEQTLAAQANIRPHVRERCRLLVSAMNGLIKKHYGWIRLKHFVSATGLPPAPVRAALWKLEAVGVLERRGRCYAFHRDLIAVEPVKRAA